MKSSATATAARVLLILDAVGRVSPFRVSDLDLFRLAYFADAFSPLWDLEPLDPYYLKADEPRSISVRQAITRLVVSGVVEPIDVKVVTSPTPHVSARYSVQASLAAPVFEAIRATSIGRREIEMVDEVVFAAAALLDDSLHDAVLQDASYSDARVGPSDVVDVNAAEGTSAVALLFMTGVASHSHVEAELTHLYMSHLERRVTGG